jgi:hypothetical protein
MFDLDSNQIIGGLIGLGLVVKGVAEWIVRRPSGPNTKLTVLERGCLYGDEAHAKLEKLVRQSHDECLSALAKLSNNQTRIITILEERKER